MDFAGRYQASLQQKAPSQRGFPYHIGPYWIFFWWRRGESNPRPKTLHSGLLRAFPVF